MKKPFVMRWYRQESLPCLLRQIHFSSDEDGPPKVKPDFSPLLQELAADEIQHLANQLWKDGFRGEPEQQDTHVSGLRRAAYLMVNLLD